MPRRALPASSLGWAFFTFVAHGVVLRILSVAALLSKWANSHQKSLITVAAGLSVGALEDGCVAVLVSVILWLFGLVLSSRGSIQDHNSTKIKATVVAVVFLLSSVLFCVDGVFLRTRQMRFRWDFVVLYWRERHTDSWRQLQIEQTEWVIAYEMTSVTLGFTMLLWWQLANSSMWIHSPLAEWDRRLWQHASAPTKCSHSLRTANSEANVRGDNDNATLINDTKGPQSSLPLRMARMLLLWLAVTSVTVGVTKSLPSIIPMLAWNASLCEPLRLVVGVECIATRSPTTTDLRQLIDTSTENYSFVGENTNNLVRKTNNFLGPLAFDVQIQPQEQPNVLLVVIESFRQRDSRYLLESSSFLDQFLPQNISLTPSFDRWTKKGVGFRNMWSTWRTSRSLEQLLFGQLPFDSATDSGTTTGHKHVTLSGLPQLFKAKGYDTLFTSGSRLDYDDWDVFLPSHGFDTTLDGWDLAHIAEKEMGIDWTEGDRTMAFWGIHDDLSFDVLAHTLKQRQSRKKQAKGNPFFATHYTISSHVPFDERPDWYFRMRENGELPDFSPLYESIDDDEIKELVKNYAEMRYFTDLCFGVFMAELDRSGVLNDTIIVVTADHGHAPEQGVAMPEKDQVSAMQIPAALIAQGRLGDYAGTVIDEPTAQYDWLNTLADIVGVMPDGFIQTGIGRSLKRQWTGDQPRVVYSHNPALNLAAVQGHTRIEFFSDVVDVMRVFNVERDPHRAIDLVGELPKHRLHEIQRICDHGRALNAYFTQRWMEKCLLPPLCEPYQQW